MSSSPASVYAAEISHPDLRGRLTALSALCTALGMLFVYLLGYSIPVSPFDDKIIRNTGRVNKIMNDCKI